MSTISIKKLLLAGTALVTAAVISSQAYAAAVLLDGTPSDDTWAEGTGAVGTASKAVAGDGPVSLAAHTLLITNDQTANDGSANKNTFSLGVVNNNTAGAGAINIVQPAAGSAATLSVTISGVTNTGAGASTLTISNNDTAAQDISVLIGATGLELGGALTLLNNGLASTGQSIGLTVTGTTAVTGSTIMQAGTGAGDSVSITNTGNATYANMGLGAGAGAGANATLNLNGATNQVGLVDLIDSGTGDAQGQAILNFGTGTSTTTVTVGISGNADDEGVVNLLGSNTITGAVGALHPVYELTAGVAGTTSSISGAVGAATISVYGQTNGAAGSIAFGNTLTADSVIVESAGTNTAQAESATVAGNTTVSGVTGVVAGSFAGASSTLTLNGAANTLTGATGVIASTAGANATLVVNGANNTLGGLVSLIDSGTGSSGGQAILTFGTGATNVTLTTGVTGGGTNEGTVNLLGANAITGAIGTTNAVNAVNAGVQGTTSSISGAVRAGTVTINGGSNAAATGTTNFGSTLTVGAGGLTVSSAGTAAAQVEASTVTGVLTDAGTLNITAGAGAGAHASLRLNGATNTITGVTTLDDNGGNATLTIGGGSSVTFTGGIIGASTNEGTLALLGASTITGQVGSASNLLKSVTLAGGALDAFTGDIFVTTLAYGASNSTVQIADGKNITAAITATNTGTLTFLGTSSVSGQVGAGGAVVSTINTGAATGKTTTFNNGVFATTLNVGAGAVDLKGATTGNLVFGNAAGTATLESGQTLAGNINGTGGNTTTGVGNVVLAGTNTITGQIGNTGILNALTLSGTGVTDTVTSAAATVNAANTTTLGTNTLAVGTNNFTLGANQTLVSTISSAAAYGKVTSTGATAVDAASKVNLTVATTGYLPTTTFVLVDGGSGTAVSALNAGGLTINGVNDGAAQSLTLGAITYTQVGAGTDQLEILATNNGSASVASSSNNAAVAHALDTIAATGNAALQTVQSHVAAATTTGAVNAILSALTPTVDNGAQTASLQAVSQVQGITDARITAALSDDDMSGVSSGVSGNGASMWIQGYGANSDQDARDSVAGYSASTFGTAIGADTENIIEDGLLGIAFSYGKADITSQNANTTATTVDNYGLSLYGVAGLQSQMFLEGQMGFAYNTISSVRHDVGGIAGVSASGNTNSNQYNAKVTIGRDFERWLLGDVIVTPDFSASYTYLSTQGYTETGPGANMVVGGNSQSNLDMGIGGKIAWYLKEADGSVIKPVLRADYSYAVVDDRIGTTSSFAGAAPGNNPSFVTEGPTPERNRFDVGVGITYLTTANWDLTANYLFEYRSDYTANAGTLRLTAHF